MRMPFPKFKKEKLKYFLTLDIGTEAIKALIFKRENKKITILGSSLQYFEQFGIFDSKDFEKEVLKKTISKVIEEAQRQAKTKTVSTLLGLPPIVLKGKVISQSFNRKNPKEIIDKKEEEEIIADVLERSKKEFSQAYTQKTGILPEDIKFINLNFLERKIDGYSVPSLRGLDGKLLNFKVLVTFLPKLYLQNIQKIVEDLNLKIFKITHEDQLLQYFFEPKISDAIFLDIGGEISQIFLVKDGKLEMIDEFKFGGEIFSQTLSQAFGITLERARNLKHQYSKGLLSEGVRKRIKEKFRPIANDWLSDLKSKLLGQKTLIPSTIFLFGGGSLLPEIEEVFHEGDLEVLPLTDLLQIKFLYPKDLEFLQETTSFSARAELPTNILNNPQYTPTLLICYAV